MKKSVSLIILVIAFLASQTIPVLEPTATVAPTNTFEPTPTPIPFTPSPSNTPVPPAPTEIYINPDYLDGLEEQGFDKQSPLETRHLIGSNKDVKFTFCAIDFKGRSKVNFKYANLLILRVTKCYFLDFNGKNQFVTVPLLIYNKDLDSYFDYYGFTDGKVKPSENYFDNVFKQLVEASPYRIYTLMYFYFNTTDPRDKFHDSFFEKAVKLFGDPSEKFYVEGDVSEFQDYLGAENFIVPSKMWNDRGK